MTRRFPISADEATRREAGDLLSVPGLRGAGVACGIKESGKRDLAIVTADAPMRAAAVFTTCQVAAAPVRLGQAHLIERPSVKTIVVNSGNANAMTGAPGLADARRMVEAAEAACGGPAFVLSTGVIGRPLPMERVLDGIDQAARSLAPDAGSDVADAFLTTDLTRKVAAERVGPYTVGGVAKGSGMIHPDMATMLAVVATDAPLAADRLPDLLRTGVDDSFHCITVDGDTSTNDTVLLLAHDSDDGLDPDLQAKVEAAVRRVMRSLALQIVEDGEGVSRLLDIIVEGTASDADARTIARGVATSSLVKTAVAGGDPNWGRIVAAAGNAGVPFTTADLAIGDHVVVRDLAPTGAPQAELEALFAAPRVTVRLRVGEGPGHSHIVTTDLTHEYVSINADYTT